SAPTSTPSPRSSRSTGTFRAAPFSASTCWASAVTASASSTSTAPTYAGADGEPVFNVTGVTARRDAARYSLEYGKPAAYTLFVDYNKIIHRFGNDGHMLYTYTGGGRYEIADPIQKRLQTALG